MCVNERIMTISRGAVVVAAYVCWVIVFCCPLGQPLVACPPFKTHFCSMRFLDTGFWGGGFVAPFLATFYYFGFKVRGRDYKLSYSSWCLFLLRSISCFLSLALCLLIWTVLGEINMLRILMNQSTVSSLHCYLRRPASYSVVTPTDVIRHNPHHHCRLFSLDTFSIPLLKWSVNDM